MSEPKRRTFLARLGLLFAALPLIRGGRAARAEPGKPSRASADRGKKKPRWIGHF